MIVWRSPVSDGDLRPLRAWHGTSAWRRVLAPFLLILSACNPGTPHVDAMRETRAVDTRTHTKAGAGEHLSTGDSPAPATRLGALSNDTLPEGFAMATRPIPFEFPRDHGPHPDFRHEWWYVTGHLDARTGERFGFELTFFRFALAPQSQTAAMETSDSALAQAASADASSAWRTRQIYMAHFAVTDLDRERFQAFERFGRGALGLAGAQAEPFRVWLDDWSLEALPPEEGHASPDALDMHLRAAENGYAFDLTLRTASPIMLNGEAGLSRKSSAPGAASYYYSIPRLAVSGRVERDGKPLEVEGLAWLDREWGSGSLGADQQGWDWFALQLDDGSALMFYALRTEDGTRDPHSAGTWLAPDGTMRSLANEDVRIEVQDHWDSPRGGRYPARWRLQVPSLALDVDVRPRLADQELQTDPRYWEGAATISGMRAGKAVKGRAYVELVGYAR